MERGWFITENAESTEKGFRVANFSAKPAGMFPRLIVPLALAIATSVAAAEDVPNTQVPRQVDNETVLLPTQWFLRPVGRQIVVGDFPVNIALAPGGRFAAVLHSGNGRHEIVVIDAVKGALVSRVALEESFYGLAFSADGKRLHCSGAGDEVVHVFDFADGFLSAPRAVQLRAAAKRGVPGGLAVAKDGTIYVANVWGHTVSRVRQGKSPQVTELPLVAPNPPAAEKPATTDDPSITKRTDAQLEPTKVEDPFPYTCVLDEKRSRVYVSLWAKAQVAVIDTKKFAEVTRWKVEEHPNEMLLAPDGARLFVANANRNSVSVLDPATGATLETLVATLPIPGLAGVDEPVPPGNTPNSLALSPDGKRLFVANANINAVAVFDVHEPGKSRSLGFIPVGWYPTSVRVTADGKRLLVANGKGVSSDSNRRATQPGMKTMTGVREYIGSLFDGTVSVIDLPAGEAFDKRLAEWTARAFRCTPEKTRELDPATLEGNPIPRRPGESSPIKYVVYIVKENRTFDQVLGDLGKGNGDPSLCLFGEKITPNHHALAREFVCLDNFYVESEVSADGHEWSMGAYATDFVEKNWPLSYGHNSRKKYPYPSEGTVDHAARPAGGYLWDRAKEAGVTYRSYGEWVSNGRTPNDPCKAKVKALEGHIDPMFRSFDMDYPDSKRADRFIAELGRFEQEGEMPQLQIVRLPSDHTSGTSPGKPTPIAHVADNDLAFGRVIEALSKSKFWPQMAIFVVEDDAQNGPDHVDAHRTIAYAISPYVRRGAVDSSLYSTSSMLRTIELILGMKPMSQFDAAALPMFASFQKEPDLRPYVARAVEVDMSATNARTAWGGKASRKMDFSKEDAADDLQLNEVIWRSVRGPNSPMPAPRRAAFVFTRGAEEEED